MECDIEGTPQDTQPMDFADRTIVAKAKYMLEAQKLKKPLWMEAVANVVHLLNQCPIRALA